MEPAMLIAIIGLFIEVLAFIIAGVWVVGKIKTESVLNRAAVNTLSKSMDSLGEVNKELTRAIRHIDTRVTVLETLNHSKD
jgi:hypothetical protein